MSTHLGDYRLLRRLAQGGMGEVYLAVLEREGGFSKTVALKTLLPTLADRAELGALFESEARLAALLNHANIVQTFDHGSADGRVFLAMEHVEGPDLARVLQAHGARPVPAGVAAELGLQALRGLGHAHQRRDLEGRPVGIVHGDVSPSNILITREGQVKLADFGLARLRSLTAAGGALAGKLAYMSPEQAAGEALGPESDLFSLGLVLYELLTGSRAYPPEEPERMLPLLRAGRVRPLGESCPELPATQVAFLGRALEPRREARYPTSSDMAQALAGAIAPAGPDGLAAFVAGLPAALEETGARLPERTELAASPVRGVPSPGRPARRGAWFALFGLCWGVAAAWWWLHAPALPVQPEQTPQPLARPATPPAAASSATWLAAGLVAGLPGRPLASPAPDERSGPPRSSPTPRPDPPHGLSLTFADALQAELDHAPAAGPRLRLDARDAHLVRLTPRDRADGAWEILLRVHPPQAGAEGWRLTVGSNPWMRVWLQGRPMGHTPRTNLRLPSGKARLELGTGELRVPLELEVPGP
jgi:serine/threonine-protein kinase